MATDRLKGTAATATGLGERLGSSAREVAHNVHEMAATMKDAAHDKLGDLRGAASEAYQQGRAKVRGAGDTAHHWIVARPFTSVLIALGIGLVLGRVWLRRD